MAVKVKDFLKEVQEALDNQYDSLFDNDKLNMTVSMEAMSIALRRDGLIDDLGISGSPFMNMNADFNAGPAPAGPEPNFVMSSEPSKDDSNIIEL